VSDNTIGSSTATMPLNQQNKSPHPSTQTTTRLTRKQCCHKETAWCCNIN